MVDTILTKIAPYKQIGIVFTLNNNNIYSTILTEKTGETATMEKNCGKSNIIFKCAIWAKMCGSEHKINSHA